MYLHIFLSSLGRCFLALVATAKIFSHLAHLLFHSFFGTSALNTFAVFNIQNIQKYKSSHTFSVTGVMTM